MIPFYFFRKRAPSPSASIYHKGVLDNLDEWGYLDRKALIEELIKYSRLYGLDWALTIVMLQLVVYGVTFLLYSVIFGRAPIIDFEEGFFICIISAIFSYAGSVHIVEEYARALDFEGGGDV